MHARIAALEADGMRIQKKIEPPYCVIVIDRAQPFYIYICTIRAYLHKFTRVHGPRNGAFYMIDPGPSTAF